MEEKRKKWKENIPEPPKTKLIFLDESGVNTNMVRRYGRSVGKQRVVDAVSLNTSQTTTVLSAMRLDGQFVCRTFERRTTKERFLEYLLSYLKKGDLVVMGQTQGAPNQRRRGTAPLCGYRSSLATSLQHEFQPN